jgi:hypothetical protein
MAGLEIDFGAGTLKAPSSLDRTQVDSARQFLLYAPSPQTGTHAAFRREWFGKIIDRYRGSRTRIIFLRLPRGPIPRPGYLVRKRSSTIHEFAFRPGVLLTRQEAFDELERPELFKDGLHLNHDGCTRFSAMLAHEIAGMLGPATFEQASR